MLLYEHQTSHSVCGCIRYAFNFNFPKLTTYTPENLNSMYCIQCCTDSYMYVSTYEAHLEVSEYYSLASLSLELIGKCDAH